MSTLGDKVTETIVGAVGKGLQGAGMAQHDDLKALVAPRVETYLSALDPDSVEYRELAHLTSDTSLLDILLMLIGSVIGLILSVLDVGGPQRENVKHGVWGTYPTKHPSASEITIANMRGALAADSAAEMLRQEGFGQLPQTIITSALQRPMDPGQVQDLFLRGEIDAKKVLAKLQAAGLSVEDQGLFFKLMWRIASLQDLFRLADHGLLEGTEAGKPLDPDNPPAGFIDGAFKVGVDKDLATLLWQTHFDHPSAGQALEMWQRGIITEDQLRELLTVQGLSPEWQDQVKTLSQALIPRLAIRQLLHLGLMTEQQALDAHKALGFDDRNAALMVEYCKSFYGAETEDPASTDRDLTKAEVLDGYRQGVITSDEARTALKSLNYTDTAVDFYLQEEDLKNSQALKQAYLDRYKALYVNGIYAADQVTQEMSTLGLGTTEINQNLALWNLQRISSVQRPTKTELIRWYKAGLITRDVWVAEMHLEGFSDRYISWYDAEITKTPAEAEQTTEAT